MADWSAAFSRFAWNTWGVCTANKVLRSGVDSTSPDRSATFTVSVTGTAGATA